MPGFWREASPFGADNPRGGEGMGRVVYITILILMGEITLF